MTIVSRRITNVNYRTITTALAPQAISVGTTSSTIVAENNARSGLVIVNVSNNNVFLAFGTDALLNGGLCLLPGVGWRMDDFTFVVDDVRAISNVDGSAVAVQEFSI